MTNKELEVAVVPTPVMKIYDSFMDFKERNCGRIDPQETAELIGVVGGGVWLTLDVRHGMLAGASINSDDVKYSESKTIAMIDVYDFRNDNAQTISSYSKYQGKIQEVYKNKGEISKFDTRYLVDCLNDLRVLSIGSAQERRNQPVVSRPKNRFQGMLEKTGIFRSRSS